MFPFHLVSQIYLVEYDVKSALNLKTIFHKTIFFSLTGNHWWRQNIYWKGIVKNSDLAVSNFASRNRISQSIFQDFLEYFSELSEDLQIEAVAVFFLEFGPTLIEREKQKKQQIRRTTLAAVSYWRFKHVKKAPIAVCVSPAVPLPPTSLFGNTIFSKGITSPSLSTPPTSPSSSSPSSSTLSTLWVGQPGDHATLPRTPRSWCWWSLRAGK